MDHDIALVVQALELETCNHLSKVNFCEKAYYGELTSNRLELDNGIVYWYVKSQDSPS